MMEHARRLEIAANPAVGGEWWKRHVADLQAWSTPFPAATETLGTGMQYIGSPWDGFSALKLDMTELPGHSLCLMLDDIRKHFGDVGLSGVSVPDKSNIRTGFNRLAASAGFVVEFDLGDFVLPIRIRDWTISRADGMTELPARMVNLVRQALQHRDVIARREARLRAAFEEATSRMGHGVHPLWLRLNPVDVERSQVRFRELGYEWCFAMLNQNLDWAPIGDHKVWTVADIRREVAYHERDQKLRAARARQLAASGAEGFVDDVAQALISELGLNVRQVMSQARHSARRDPQSGMEFIRDGNLETLRFVDGVLEPTFDFEGGRYHAGTLTIWGSFPETIAAGAQGRLLADFVDHPALRAAGVRVSEARCRADALDLDHATRLQEATNGSVEAAENIGVVVAA